MGSRHAALQETAAALARATPHPQNRLAPPSVAAYQRHPPDGAIGPTPLLVGVAGQAETTCSAADR